MKWIATLCLALFLAGCYETGYERQKRLDLEARVQRLERQRAADDRYGCTVANQAPNGECK